MSYEVRATSDRLTLNSGQSRVLQFTVANTSDEPLNTAIKLHVDGSVDEAWCSVSPSGDQQIEPRESQVYTLTIAPNGVQQACSGRIGIEAAWVSRPNQVFTRGPDVEATVLPPAEAPPWWNRHGWKVLVAAGAVVVITVASVFLFSGGPLEVNRLDVTWNGKDTGAVARQGDIVHLAWAVGGSPDDVFFTVDGGPEDHLPEDQREAGERSLPVVDPGTYEIQLNAVVHDGEQIGRAQKSFRLEVQPPAQPLAPALVSAFATDVPNPQPAQTVMYTWTLGGDVASAQVEFGDGSFYVLPEALYASGQTGHMYLSRAQPYRALLNVIGKDGKPAQSNPIVVTVAGDLDTPRVEKFEVSGAGQYAQLGRSTNYFRKVRVQWRIHGEYKSLALRIGDEPTVQLDAREGDTEYEMRVPTGTQARLEVSFRDVAIAQAAPIREQFDPSSVRTGLASRGGLDELSFQEEPMVRTRSLQAPEGPVVLRALRK